MNWPEGDASFRVFISLCDDMDNDSPRPMKTTLDPIREAIDSRYPVIYLHSAEEQRMLARLRELAEQHYGGRMVRSWTCTRGFEHDPGAASDYREPLAAIQAILADPQPGFYVMLDLAPFMQRPEVARALRDAYFALSAGGERTIFIVSPERVIPASLEKNLRLIRMPPPDSGEIERLVRSVTPEYTNHELPREWVTELAFALKGLTLDEARHVLHGILSSGKLSRERMLEGVKGAKMGAADGASYLQYVSQPVEMEAIGGLSRLKDWIDKRTRVFNHRTLAAGLPIPKGFLVTGISGCGKSLCAKAVAHAWGVPLFRLDMNLVYSNRHGNPEASFDQALRLVESAAPAVLWIDEIENGLGSGGAGQDTSNHILSAFLTWMQEKPPMVFVAATANRIEALPAELIRKGRFDQVFFCDLPNEQDRAEIFRIHLRHNQANVADFDLQQLVKESLDWNAAEIEQAVIAGRIDALHAGHGFATEDVLRHCRIMVPLARTMSEQIKFIRDWAWDRATPASEGRSLEFSDSISLQPSRGKPT